MFFAMQKPLNCWYVLLLLLYFELVVVLYYVYFDIKVAFAMPLYLQHVMYNDH